MFEPASPSRAPDLDSGMREHLAVSLERIGQLAALDLADEADMAPALAHVREHRTDPGVFARYYDLVFALQANDRATASRLWGQILRLALDESPWRLIPFGPESLGEDAERFARLVSPGDGPFFLPPEPAEWQALQARIGEALDLLGQICPPWAEEVQGLVNRVIGVQPGDTVAGGRFAGASCFMIWGAVFINASLADNQLAALSTLVHEATHQLLFAVSRDQPLVTNPPEARYPSPLRKDLRPMDGVFHATYVAARLSRLYEMALASGLRYAAAESAWLQQRFERSREGFAEGYEVVRSHGLLTARGRSVIEEAADYVLASA